MLSSNLKDKVAIVTGSGRGLGAAIALRLAEEKVKVTVNDIQRENAEKIASEIEKLGVETHVSTHDISDRAQAQSLVEETASKLGGVDILVNNAGITRDAMLGKLTEEDFDLVIKVNLKGSFNMGQACSQFMKEKKSGRIINFASVAWQGNIGQTNYSASKAGVIGLTYTWALELAKYGITANAIAPGFFDTEMTKKIPQEIKEAFVQKIPHKRMGKPNEIAELVTFLASDRASYLTGQVIHLDGGLSTGL